MAQLDRRKKLLGDLDDGDFLSLPPMETDENGELVGTKVAALDRLIKPENEVMSTDRVPAQLEGARFLPKPFIRAANPAVQALTANAGKAQESYDRIMNQMIELQGKANFSEDEGKALDTIRETQMKKLMDAYDRANQRKEPNTLDTVGTMLFGLGGGFAGGMSQVPNSGYQIAKSALDAKADAIKRRERVIDDTPEIKAILSAMKMKQENVKSREELKKPYLDLLGKTQDTVRNLSKDAQDAVLEWAKLMQAGDIKGAELALERAKMIRSKQQEKETAFKEFGKAIQPHVGELRNWKSLGEAIGPGFSVSKLSENPEMNKEVAAKLGNIPIYLSNDSWAKWLSDAGLNQTERNKAVRLRGAIEGVFGKIRHDLLGAAQSEQEASNIKQMFGQGQFSSNEAVLARLGALFNAHKLTMENYAQTYGSQDPALMGRLKQAFPWANYQGLDQSSPVQKRSVINSVRQMKRGAR
jgi:hypothetical protein